jgi:hypothetical protein
MQTACLPRLLLFLLPGDIKIRLSFPVSMPEKLRALKALLEWWRGTQEIRLLTASILTTLIEPLTYITLKVDRGSPSRRWLIPEVLRSALEVLVIKPRQYHSPHRPRNTRFGRTVGVR